MGTGNKSIKYALKVHIYGFVLFFYKQKSKPVMPLFLAAKDARVCDRFYCVLFTLFSFFDVVQTPVASFTSPCSNRSVICVVTWERAGVRCPAFVCQVNCLWKCKTVQFHAKCSDRSLIGQGVQILLLFF